MRHRRSGRKLGLTTDQRRAMLRQLAEALFLHGRIRTTLTRAKETRPLAERVVTWAKKGSLHHRRLALALIPRQDVVRRVFTQLVEWYKDRPGGYTRIIKLGPRPGDGAPMAFLELVDWIPGEKLAGQHAKQEKKPEGEEGAEQAEKGEKAKKAKAKEAKPAPKKGKAEVKPAEKPKHPKDQEKEKKKAERRAAQEKLKQERAAARDKAKQEKQKQAKAAEPAKGGKGKTGKEK